MKNLRIYPETWASTLCPFSSSTRNIALGRGSMTVPSTVIASSLATRHSTVLNQRAQFSDGADFSKRVFSCQVKAFSPVSARPMVKVWTSWVPS